MAPLSKTFTLYHVPNTNGERSAFIASHLAVFFQQTPSDELQQWHERNQLLLLQSQETQQPCQFISQHSRALHFDRKNKCYLLFITSDYLIYRLVKCTLLYIKVLFYKWRLWKINYFQESRKPWLDLGQRIRDLRSR